MAVYKVISKQLANNFAVLQTLEPNDIVVGQSIIVADVAVPFNATAVVWAVPQYRFIGIDNTTSELLYDTTTPLPNQLLYVCTGSAVARTYITTGTVTYTQTCSWISATNIEDWLGIGTASAADTTFLTQCASSANMFCYRRRQENGYADSLTTSPGGDVTLGVIMYGGWLYRQRGAITDFASFDGLGATSMSGLSPAIKQLLGISRPQVA